MSTDNNWAARLMHQDSFTPAELAELLDMSEAFITQEVHQGNLEGHKIGHDIVDIPRDSVLDWMKRREEAAQ
jgi:excisionase family DNA binding protein